MANSCDFSKNVTKVLLEVGHKYAALRANQAKFSAECAERIIDVVNKIEEIQKAEHESLPGLMAGMKKRSPKDKSFKIVQNESDDDSFADIMSELKNRSLAKNSLENVDDDDSFPDIMTELKKRNLMKNSFKIIKDDSTNASLENATFNVSQENPRRNIEREFFERWPLVVSTPQTYEAPGFTQESRSINWDQISHENAPAQTDSSGISDHAEVLEISSFDSTPNHREVLIDALTPNSNDPLNRNPRDRPGMKMFDFRPFLQ